MPLRNSKLKRYQDATRKKKEMFDRFKEIALQSDMRSKHSACLVYNGKIIAFSTNHYGNDINSHSIHAEQSVHRQFQKIQHKLKKRIKYELWVFRFSEASGTMNSKPCSNCTKFIQESMPYVKKVYYSWDNEHFICEDKRDLKTNHVSLGYQHSQKKQQCCH